MKPFPARNTTEFALRERVKELACLYAISEVSQLDNMSIDRQLSQILALIPPAWQYPEQAAARIIIGHQHFTAPNFRETSQKQFDIFFMKKIAILSRMVFCFLRCAITIHLRNGASGFLISRMYVIS